MRKYLWFFLSLSFFSCSEKSFIEMPSNENPNEQKVAQEAKAQVALSDVSQKCLNVALYAKALASLDSSVLALQSTTDVVFQPLNEARDSFRLTTAFGNFRFQKIPVREIDAFRGVQQLDCRAIKYESYDGPEKIFFIIKATNKMLSAATSSGEEIYFEWLSPQSMKIKHKYTVYDLPCSSNRAQTEVSQVFDWSNPSADFIDLENSLHRINKEYLKEVTEAAGFPFDDLFIDASESPESDMKKLVRVQKLYELQERNIRAELLSCASERENHPPIGDNPPSSGGNYSFFGI